MGIIPAKEVKEKSEFMLNINLIIFNAIWEDINASEAEFDGEPSDKELKWLKELNLKIEKNKLKWES